MNLSRETTLEIGVRVILMLLFSYYDKAEPFVRHIQPEEIWLYKYPITASYVPSTILWCFCLGLPTLSFTLFYIFDAKTRKEIRTAISGLTLAFALNAFLTSYVKILVGRPRPDFANRCFPDGIGTDFTKCLGRPDLVHDGRKSFPSGHSSFSFVVMVFLSLCFLRWFEVSTIQKLRGLKLTFCLSPVLLATTIAISRTCDYHHHYQDVVVGSLMGATIAYGVFKLYLKNEITNGRSRGINKETETLTADCK